MYTLLFFLTLLTPSMLRYHDYHDIDYGIKRNPYGRKFHDVPLRVRKYNFPVAPAHRPRDSFREWLRAKTKTKKRQKKAAEFPTRPPPAPNMSITVFPVIKNMQVDADKINDESKYPWVARVIHSPQGTQPFLCTAVCIEERIFMTAARCLSGAKVSLTSVIYQKERIMPIAIVLSSEGSHSKQWFDDIGFIIANRDYKGKWESAKFYGNLELLKRSDTNFFWFEKLGWLKGIAIGHVVDPDDLSKQSLHELEVTIGIYLCNWINGFGQETIKPDYFVPCYHSCTLIQDLHENSPVCKKYLAGEGHVVIEATTKGIIGIATWAGYFGSETKRFPVGMAVVGADVFNKDLSCARIIKNAPVTTSVYNKLCD